MLRSKPFALNAVIAVIGVGLLLYTVQRVGGWSAIAGGIASVGYWFILVVMLGAARMAVRARAWVVCADAPDFRLRDAFAAVLAGDAAGNLTPLGLLASEPTKILLSRTRIPTVIGVASVAIENAFYIASVSIVLLAGTWLLLQRATLPTGLERLAEVVIAIFALSLPIVIWAARRRPAVLSRLAPVVTRLAGRPAVPTESVREVETRIYDVPQWPLPRLLHVSAWEALFHVLAVAEVWLVLRLLPGGDAVTMIDAFLMESAGRFVTIAFKFVPYRLGIDEVGSGAVAQVLGLAPATGVTLALVRRLRIIVLNVAGLLKLVHGR